MLSADLYTSVLHLFTGLPSLQDCTTAAGELLAKAKGTPDESAYKKGLDFFAELSKTDIVNIKYDVAHLLARHTLDQVKIDDDVAELLYRVKDMPSSELIRDDENNLFIRRKQSASDGYRRANAYDCDCDYMINRPDSDKMCVHIAIVRIVEQAFVNASVFETVNGVQ